MQYPNFEFTSENNGILISFNKTVGYHTMPYNHFHHTYEIYYLVSGERYYFINDRTYHVKKGDLVLINKQELHRTLDAQNPNHERILINFDSSFITTNGDLIGDILKFLFVNNNLHVIRCGIQEQSYIKNLLFQMLEEVQNSHLGFLIQLQSLLMQLLVFTCRYVKQNLTAHPSHPTPMHAKVSEVVQYINQHYMDPLALPFLAEHFYISPYYLSRVFKEATGFTFIEYLNTVRVKEAQRLLRDTSLKVIEIAEKVGFGSISHFGRMFRSLTGISPLQYRKINKIS